VNSKNFKLYFKLKERLNGLEVTVACKKQDYDNPPPIGSVITVKYDGTTANGKIQLNHGFPMYMRIRPDVAWEELKREHVKDLVE
jgi:ATP-dependent DNA ligase